MASSIDTYLSTYRELLPVGEFPSPDMNSLANGTKHLVTLAKLESLKLIDAALDFMDEHNASGSEELLAVYEKMLTKLDHLENIAKSYQSLNTNELNDTAIYNLIAYDLKALPSFNILLNGLSLPENAKAKALRANKVERTSKGAVETHRIASGNDQRIGKVIVLDPSQTLLKRVICANRAGQELLSTSNKVFMIPKGTRDIVVVTESTNSTAPGYTVLDIYEEHYSEADTITLPDKSIHKTGNILKTLINHNLPTDCDIIVTVTLRSKEFSASGSWHLNQPASYQSEGLKALSEGTFDISAFPSKDLTLSLSFQMLNNSVSHKTPLITGVFAYVTNT